MENYQASNYQDFIDFDINFDSIFEGGQEGGQGGESGSLLELLTGSNLLEISHEIRKSWRDVKDKTDHIRTKFRQTRKKFIRDRITSIKSKMSTQKAKRSIDKFTFVLGVTYIWATCLTMARFADLMPLYYVLTVFPMIVIRWFTYKSKKWHFFLADLCYFVNALLISVLFFYRSTFIYTAVFFLSNGPVAWAIYAWRNALVFHSLDKVTSIAIHISPALVVYTLRWFSLASPPTFPFIPTYPEFAVHPDPLLDSSMKLTAFSALFNASIVYMVWQGLYCYFILVVNAEKVFDNSHATSYTWLVADYMKKKQTNILTRIFLSFPDSFHPFLFILTQYLYAILTMIPVIFYYNSFYIHTAFIIFLVMLSVFNGADYYIEVFSHRYRIELDRLEKQASILSPDLTATDLGSAMSLPPNLSSPALKSSNSSLSLADDFGDECPITVATTKLETAPSDKKNQ